MLPDTKVSFFFNQLQICDMVKRIIGSKYKLLKGWTTVHPFFRRYFFQPWTEWDQFIMHYA